EASTSTLVVMVHFMISHYVLGRPGDTHRAALNSLLVRSLLGDGEFVRLMHRKLAAAWVKKFDACLHASAKAGEMHELPIRRALSAGYALGGRLCGELSQKVSARAGTHAFAGRLRGRHPLFSGKSLCGGRQKTDALRRSQRVVV